LQEEATNRQRPGRSASSPGGTPRTVSATSPLAAQRPAPRPRQICRSVVTPLRDARAMTVIEQAREQGYELEE
jgi:hypothetical protein